MYVNNILILSIILELCKSLFQIIIIGCKYFIIYNYFILKYQPKTFTEFIPNYKKNNFPPQNNNNNNSLYESQIKELNKKLEDEKNKNKLLNDKINSLNSQINMYKSQVNEEKNKNQSYINTIKYIKFTNKFAKTTIK